MRIINDNENTLLINVKDFSIEQTLECGQCFNFDKINENEYVIIAKGKLLHIKQEDETITLYNVNDSNDVKLWIEYLDLDRNYGEIKSFLLNRDLYLQEAIESKYGVRILNQEFYESLLSFIISQNKNITHIKQIVKTISERYGEPLGEVCGRSYYSFPSISRLSSVTDAEFRECKVGFRAPYLVDAIKHLNNDLNTETFINLPIDEARNRLIEIKGVGTKISNCVLLFGLGYREAFPVDVWIKRTMEEIYFNKETPINQIQEFAEERFGKYGGYAQQYLFYYGRDNKIGKKTSN